MCVWLLCLEITAHRWHHCQKCRTDILQSEEEWHRHKIRPRNSSGFLDFDCLNLHCTVYLIRGSFYIHCPWPTFILALYFVVSDHVTWIMNDRQKQKHPESDGNLNRKTQVWICHRALIKIYVTAGWHQEKVMWERWGSPKRRRKRTFRSSQTPARILSLSHHVPSLHASLPVSDICIHTDISFQTAWVDGLFNEKQKFSTVETDG